MDRTELAWAAGFWDGEGSAYLTGARDRATRQPQARINQSSTTGIPEVLTRFQRAVGLGSVKGPDIKDGREPLYRWVDSSRNEIMRLFELLDPWIGEVKRGQLQQVLGVDFGRRSFEDLPPDEQRAWAAGVWDGEGSICLLKHRSHPGHFVPEASVTQSDGHGRPQVLERLQLVAGGGYWYGPFVQDGATLPVYRWKLFQLSEIRALLDLIWPWLGVVKRSQAEGVTSVLLSQPALPRGNPTWGSHKTHCIRDHDYATARVRPFRGRGKNAEPRRASRQCLVCVRAGARRKRLDGKRRAAADQPPLM